MTVLPFILRRIPRGALSYLLAVSGFLALPALTIASVRCWGFAYRVRSLLVPLVTADHVTAPRRG